uniref:Uncharacterized protein n=1 Tax=Arundo donax TaxID=35708 RepID=A0A0A9D1S9_ARUDO
MMSGRSNRESSALSAAGGGEAEAALASGPSSGSLAQPLAGAGKSAAAASAAAAWTSLGAAVAGRGSSCANSGKLRCAARPLMASAATSWARAAISAVAKVPSQMRDFLRGSRISETHLPQARMRTPRYVGWCPSLRRRFLVAAVASEDDAVVAVAVGDAGASAEEEVVGSEAEKEESMAMADGSSCFCCWCVGGVRWEQRWEECDCARR